MPSHPARFIGSDDDHVFGHDDVAGVRSNESKPLARRGPDPQGHLRSRAVTTPREQLVESWVRDTAAHDMHDIVGAGLAKPRPTFHDRGSHGRPETASGDRRTLSYHRVVDTPDPTERIGDDFGLDGRLHRTIEVREVTPTAPVRHLRTHRADPIDRRLDDLVDHRARVVTTNLGDPGAHPFTRKGTSDEDDAATRITGKPVSPRNQRGDIELDHITHGVRRRSTHPTDSRRDIVASTDRPEPPATTPTETAMPPTRTDDTADDTADDNSGSFRGATRPIEIAPSVLPADFSRLGEACVDLENAGVDRIQWDVMDGNFVPNLTFGADVIASVRPHVTIPFETHLMVDEPTWIIPAMVEAGCETVIVHAEACRHLHRTLGRIHDEGARAAVAIDPATAPHDVEHVLDLVSMVLVMTVNPGFGGQSYIASMASKLTVLREWIVRRDLDVDLEVDGGIGPDTVGHAVHAGANILVAGSALFRDPAGLTHAVTALRERAAAARLDGV